MPLMSRSEYARHRKELGLPGGTGAAVTYAIQSGRITIDPKTNQLDSEVADREWLANTNESQQQICVKAAQVKVEKMETRARNTPPDFQVSRANKEHFAAELERLKFEEKSGTLVPASLVKKVLYEAGRIIRSGHEDMIVQLAPALAAEETLEKIEGMLKKALTKLDEELANRIESLNERILDVEEADDESGFSAS